MKKFQLLFGIGITLTLFCVFPTFSQPLPGRSLDANTVCFPENHPIANAILNYKTAPAVTDGVTFNENLWMRISYPTDLPSTARRPVVVLMHGGGFFTGDPNVFYPTADLLAQKGFIAVSVRYRLCRRSPDCTVLMPTQWHESYLHSAYAATCDVNDAIRYLQQPTIAAQYHINASHIIVGGYSAGAVTALNAAYLDQSEVGQACSHVGNASGPVYVREQLDPPTGIKAVIGLSGAVFNPNWISGAEETNIAAFLLHGTRDQTVGYNIAPLQGCLSWLLGFPNIYGSKAIAERLHLLGAKYYLYSGINCRHEVEQQGFYDAGMPQAFAFWLKTVGEGTTVKKHAGYTGCFANADCFWMDFAMSALPLTTPFSVRLNGNCQSLAGEDFGDPAFNFGEMPTASAERADDAEHEHAEYAADGSAAVFPNPASGRVLIHLTPDWGEGAYFFLFDAQGRQLREMPVAAASETECSLENLAPGVYFWVVRDGVRVTQGKLGVAE